LIELSFRRIAPALLIARRAPPMNFAWSLRLNLGEGATRSPLRTPPARAIFVPIKNFYEIDEYDDEGDVR
jgi:hypothetical protein